uniref:Uncharacterized protein n=1 Tax=Myotis myotis TaxID=51298 RepID=A0A7J7XHT6_MYOMY|nr:hypothetical protein mMyoMyo1_011821 [Myotis myotis]
MSLRHNPHWFLQPEVMGTSLPSSRILGWGAGVGLGPLAPHRGPPQLRYPSWFKKKKRHTWVSDQTIPSLCPSSQSQCAFFFTSLVVLLPFSQLSGGSERWLFCVLVVILMWLWEAASTSVYLRHYLGSLQCSRVSLTKAAL